MPHIRRYSPLLENPLHGDLREQDAFNVWLNGRIDVGRWVPPFLANRVAGIRGRHVDLGCEPRPYY